MNSNTLRYALLACIPVFATLVIFLSGGNSAHARIAHCKDIQDHSVQTDCIYEEIRKDLENGKFEHALEIFKSANEGGFTMFVPGECHRHAHNIGHMLYYGIYLTRGGFETIDFPAGASVCSYGIFHGFLEHMFQDRPTKDFITDTCEYLDEKLRDSMQDIRETCYHAAGHGLTISQAEQVSLEDWGSAPAFTRASFDACTTLTEATQQELDQCQEGVFNILINFMTDEQFGFTFDADAPFEVCEDMEEDVVPFCYREVSRKLDTVSGHDPMKLLSIIQSAPRPGLASEWFGHGISGIVRRIGFEETLSKCWPTPDDVYGTCIRHTITGLFEGGVLQEEYKKPLEVCSHELVVSRGFADECYFIVMSRLPRFYTREKGTIICEEFPEEKRDACIAGLQERDKKSSF